MEESDWLEPALPPSRESENTFLLPSLWQSATELPGAWRMKMQQSLSKH